MIAALQVLAVAQRRDRAISEVAQPFVPVPQRLTNVRFTPGDDGATPLDQPLVKAAIRDGEARLAGAGRLLIRKSGTEPLIRVMAEGDDSAIVDAVVNDIVAAVHNAVTRA